jgi:Domain of unknown function (DUF4396)
MNEGIMTLWFILTGLSLIFIVIDIPKTPESTVLKWAFVILVVFTGPIGVFLYVLGCREPLKGMHEKYVSSTWRQVLGSTMHCAAGDGVGIIAGAAFGSLLSLSAGSEFAMEYALGFGFGWTFFQAFAMRNMVGGSYVRSLKETFVPELLSMNLLMTGMFPTMKFLTTRIEGAADPLQPAFWFTMSMALIVGFTFAYPINWWLVVHQMKHGMLTIRPGADNGVAHGAHKAHAEHESEGEMAMPATGLAAGTPVKGTGGQDEHGVGQRPGPVTIVMMTLVTFTVLAGVLWFFGGFYS